MTVDLGGPSILYVDSDVVVEIAYILSPGRRPVFTGRVYSALIFFKHPANASPALCCSLVYMVAQETAPSRIWADASRGYLRLVQKDSQCAFAVRLCVEI